MPQENNDSSYVSQAFLQNAYEQLKEFKNLSSDNIRTLTQDFLKIEKAFKCALFTGNNNASEGLVELYDEVIKKIPDYELQNINITQFRDIMVLVGRELENEKCINTSLLSGDINAKFLKPSVVTHVKTIEICQKQNSNNPFAVNEDKIIKEFNLTLNNFPYIYVPENYSKDGDEVITSGDSSCNIL
ncbi:MAG TPA: hypothetical protein LFW20_06205 [Rickettsia endosymbiont of Omalisus fontisbellaquei]|nr:hypothetical protein [Rickettsia endosymbiont of Omalisus fontisbellaquei]